MLRLFKITEDVIHEIEISEEKKSEQFKNAEWIEVYAPDAVERSMLESLLTMNLPASEAVERIEPSARCFVDQAGIHIHSLFLTQNDGRHATVSAAFILQSNRLISFRETDLPDFRQFHLRARRGQIRCENAAELLVSLLEQKVENHADMLEDIHSQLEDVSHLVLEDQGSTLPEAISKLARLEDGNGKVRMCLMDTQRDISFLLRHLYNQPNASETLREIMRDVETLISHTTFLFDKINFLMNSTQGFINIKQSQIIKILSIAAVVFLPPTLVASIYGMNFNYMPELEWLLGYPWGLALMIVSGVVPYWVFKRKGWL